MDRGRGALPMSRDKAAVDLALAWREGKRKEGPAVLCTLVDARGSSYRKLGARALFETSSGGPRRITGSVSGGCLERDLARRGAWLSSNGPRLVRYDASLEEAEEGGRIGLGCGGEVTILVEQARAAHAAMSALAAAALDGIPSAAATVVSEGE